MNDQLRISDKDIELNININTNSMNKYFQKYAHRTDINVLK